VNLSRYIEYVPYRVAWAIAHKFRKNKSIHFYCAGHVDYVVMESILGHFPNGVVVAKNRKVRNELKQYGIESKLYPTFPDIVVIPRHTARKYPEPGIKKIGMRHGAYHFKDFVKASRYHMFDIYFVTSNEEMRLAQKKGIKNTKAIGFPKLDTLFNGNYSKECLQDYREKCSITDDKPVLLFTTTWDKSGTSAIKHWISRIDELTADYHVLVTVHQWTKKRYKQILKKNNKICYVEDKNILPYLLISDVMIADLSSIIAEFCALDKPIITYIVPDGKRTPKEIKDMLADISFRVNSFDEMKTAVQLALSEPNKQSDARKKYNRIMFDELDGKAGLKASEIIKKMYF